ncbi:hypothetical protein WA026_005727 [Henosepilachna vigintioctopunctata]|uniref:Uncharacterized protein n=1 Tax=Henosepilachna vigintioctopunctata TaxID=420089 RepID=A0AAW1U2Y9_9CUCU
MMKIRQEKNGITEKLLNIWQNSKSKRQTLEADKCDIDERNDWRKRDGSCGFTVKSDDCPVEKRDWDEFASPPSSPRTNRPFCEDPATTIIHIEILVSIPEGANFLRSSENLRAPKAKKPNRSIAFGIGELSNAGPQGPPIWDTRLLWTDCRESSRVYLHVER